MGSAVPKLCGITLLLLSVLFDATLSRFVVEDLPGFPGKLPFKLETGYVGVGESEEVQQLFYYFIQSERSPENDPLMLWLTGGPGCAALSGLFYEIGPVTFVNSSVGEGTPELKLNPYSWTKVANILFVDQPVGTGHSSAESSEAYNNNDTISALMTYHFLRKWVMDHPEYLNNPLYIGGDSYTGVIVPQIVGHVYYGLEVGIQPPFNLKGYVLGNALTDKHIDINAEVQFSHYMGLLSDDLYESTRVHCNGEYLDADLTNALCQNDIQRVKKCIARICPNHVSEPKCVSSPDQRKSLQANFQLLQLMVHQEPGCREGSYINSEIWANSEDVKTALHVREGTTTEWVRCNEDMKYVAGTKRTKSYVYNVDSVLDYHRSFTHEYCRALIYSGDHDMRVSHIGTKKWIKSLQLPLKRDWEPWFVGDQVAGYTMEYSNNHYDLTYATVKAAGHTAPEYKPKECFAMIERWFGHHPL